MTVRCSRPRTSDDRPRGGPPVDGVPLSTVTTEIAAAWGVTVSIVPFTDDRVETLMDLENEGEIGFQDYFVRRNCGQVARVVPEQATPVSSSSARFGTTTRRPR